MIICIRLIPIISILSIIYLIYYIERYKSEMIRSDNILDLLEDINTKTVEILYTNKQILLDMDNVRIKRLFHKLDLLLEDSLIKDISRLNHYIYKVDDMRIYLYIDILILTISLVVNMYI